MQVSPKEVGHLLRLQQFPVHFCLDSVSLSLARIFVVDAALWLLDYFVVDAGHRGADGPFRQLFDFDAETMQNALGSLSQVIDAQLTKTLSQGIRRTQIDRLVGEIAAADLEAASRRTVDDEHPRCVTFGQRLLRDQIVGKVIIKGRNIHGIIRWISLVSYE